MEFRRRTGAGRPSFSTPSRLPRRCRDLLVELVTVVETSAPLPAGTPLASSPFTVRATFAATGLQPTALESPLDVVVAAPAAELGATPVTGLVAYSFGSDGAWTLLPTWVDREEGAVHIL